MRYALVYGLLAAAVIGAVIVSGIAFHLGGVFQTVWFGYTVMVVAMTFMFVGVRRYRDVEKGGVIRFLPALGMGLAIGLVAVVAYVLIWEAYLAATHYDFIEKFFRGPEMAELKAYYSNPIFRMWETAKELAPVALIVAFVSAALLRNPKLLPARR
jgi:polyferredoxin